MSEQSPVLRLQGVAKRFSGLPNRDVLNGVSFDVARGSVMGIVGESGSGKTTLARIMAGLVKASAGEVLFNGIGVQSLPRKALRQLRSQLQYVHQDPAAALNPHRTISDALHEPLLVHTRLSRSDRNRQVAEALDAVGLSERLLDRYPHQVSGGQQRRVGLARILILRPPLIVFDEPTAGLDLLVQASLLETLATLRRGFGLTYVVVTHDLTVAESICDEVLTLLGGCIVEQGPAEAVFGSPRHPYTRQLLASLPRILGPRVIDSVTLQGLDASTTDVMDTGCVFASRCPDARSCCEVAPPMVSSGVAKVACWNHVS